MNRFWTVLVNPSDGFLDNIATINEMTFAGKSPMKAAPTVVAPCSFFPLVLLSLVLAQEDGLFIVKMNLNKLLLLQVRKEMINRWVKSFNMKSTRVRVQVSVYLSKYGTVQAQLQYGVLLTCYPAVLVSVQVRTCPT